MKKITVNGRNLSLNARDNGSRVVYEISDCAINFQQISILGDSVLRYNQRDRAWIETNAELVPLETDMSGSTIIHVNRQHISMNANDGKDRPVFTIKKNGKTLYARAVEIHGNAHLIYNGTQLKCGARAWVCTDAEITLIDQMNFREARAVNGNKIKW